MDFLLVQAHYYGLWLEESMPSAQFLKSNCRVALGMLAVPYNLENNILQDKKMTLQLANCFIGAELFFYPWR